MAGLALLLAIGSAISWCMWQHRAHRNLRPLARSGLEYTPAWAVGWWFIPVASLWKPYGAVRELWKASDPGSDSLAWRSVPTWSAIGWWWAAWLASTVVLFIAAAQRAADRYRGDHHRRHVHDGGVLAPGRGGGARDRDHPPGGGPPDGARVDGCGHARPAHDRTAPAPDATDAVAARLTAMPVEIDIDHVALLARLDLTDEERAQLKTQLGAILEHAAKVGEVAAADVPPTASPNPRSTSSARTSPSPRSRTTPRCRTRRPRPAGGSWCRRSRRPARDASSATAPGPTSPSRLAAGEFTAVELAESSLARRRGRRRPRRRLPDADAAGRPRARGRARHVPRRPARRKPEVAGIPIALKDVLTTNGIRTTCGSKILETYVPPYDCTAWTRLSGAGSVLIGKTNCDEFAMGSSNENSAYGPVHNPWDLDTVPGGSSGGSAAAVAAGEVVWALGTDTGGSVRQPAALTGVVGLKPTYGRISRYGLIAFASSLDTVGTFTRSVRDAAILLGALAGRDHRDATSLADEPGDYLAGIDRGVEGLRVGVIADAFGEGVQPDVAASVRAAVDRLAATGRLGGRGGPPARRVRALRLLPDRAVGGVVEPRALRRRAVRPARGRRRLDRDDVRDARRRVRARGEAPDHAGHLRACRPATTTPTTARPRRSAR